MPRVKGVYEKERCMKNMFKVFGIIITVMIVLLAVGCGGITPKDPDGDNEAPSTSGRLTVTGLDAYNGYYIIAQGATNDEEMLFAGRGINISKETFTGTKIVSGQAVLNVWKVIHEDDETPELKSYNGSNWAGFYAYIFRDSIFSPENDIAKGGVYAGEIYPVIFSNGVATAAISNVAEAEEGQAEGPPSVPAALQGTWEDVAGTGKVVLTDTTFTFTMYGPPDSTFTVGDLRFATISKKVYLKAGISSLLDAYEANLAPLGITESDLDDIVNAILDDTLDALIDTLNLQDESVLDPYLAELDDIKLFLDTVDTIYGFDGKVTATDGFFDYDYEIGDSVNDQTDGPIAIHQDGTMSAFSYLFEKQ